MPKRPSMSDRKAETPRADARVDATLMGQERARYEVVELLIRELMPNRQQPRQRFDPDSLAELAQSIRLHGVLEPVIVRPIPLTLYERSGRQYELIAGERRWRASALAERATIPALVLPETTSDQAALELAITENLQREDLHPLDEASAFGRMQSELRYSYAQIADRLGKSKGYVQNRLRLLQLDDDLRQLVAERPDTLTHVYELARVADHAQRAALIAAVRADGLSRAETRTRVQALLNPPMPVTAESAEPKSYFQKYDLPPDQAATAEPAEPISYFQKYDPLPTGADTAEAAEPTSYLRKYDLSSDNALVAGDHTVLRDAAAHIAQLLDSAVQLSAADWAVLESLAEGLATLLAQRGKQR